MITDPKLGQDTFAVSCHLCGFAGKPKEVADHNCPLNPDDVSNRFDPYEALDKILRCTADAYEVDPGGFKRRTIDHQVHALRAYITGMERAGTDL